MLLICFDWSTWNWNEARKINFFMTDLFHYHVAFEVWWNWNAACSTKKSVKIRKITRKSVDNWPVKRKLIFQTQFSIKIAILKDSIESIIIDFEISEESAPLVIWRLSCQDDKNMKFLLLTQIFFKLKNGECTNPKFYIITIAKTHSNHLLILLTSVRYSNKNLYQPLLTTFRSDLVCSWKIKYTYQMSHSR